MFLPWELITSYTTASARLSLPLYSKQERPLFTAVLEQTSNVPTAGDVGRSSGRILTGLWSPVPGVWSMIATPPFAFLARISTHAPRRRRPGRCPQLNAPIRQVPVMKTNFCHMSPPVWHINEVRI